MYPLVETGWSYAIVFYVALFVWASSEWIGSLFRRVERGATIRDRGSRQFIYVMILIGVILAFVVLNRVPQTTIGRFQPVLYWLGIALMGAGILFRHYAILTLGRYFTHTVATRAGQKVVQRGPYHWIRHPGYTGSLVTVLGFGLATTNWLSLLLVLVCALTAYAYRVSVEERALCAALGDDYRDYMRRTRRFIPFLW